MGGNALAAGIGWLVRSVGLAVDQLVGVQLATADGRVVEASEDENPELFFAVRGGGGNFGVATRLDFRARRLGHGRVRLCARGPRTSRGRHPRRPRRDAQRASRSSG